MSWPILEDLESWSIDHEAGELRVVMADGREARQAWKARSEGPIDFKRVTFRPGDLILEMVTPWASIIPCSFGGRNPTKKLTLNRTELSLASTFIRSPSLSVTRTVTTRFDTLHVGTLVPRTLDDAGQG